MKGAMKPTDAANKRYILERVFPDGPWYLFLEGETVPSMIGTLADCCESLMEEEYE